MQEYPIKPGWERQNQHGHQSIFYKAYTSTDTTVCMFLLAKSLRYAEGRYAGFRIALLDFLRFVSDIEI